MFYSLLKCHFVGSMLANYTPKTAVPMEEFQFGVQPTPAGTAGKITNSLGVIQNHEEHIDEMKAENVMVDNGPMLFSAGTNSDILF